jgi:hypothetical protein
MEKSERRGTQEQMCTVSTDSGEGGGGSSVTGQGNVRLRCQRVHEAYLCDASFGLVVCFLPVSGGVLVEGDFMFDLAAALGWVEDGGSALPDAMLPEEEMLAVEVMVAQENLVCAASVLSHPPQNWTVEAAGGRV